MLSALPALHQPASPLSWHVASAMARGAPGGSEKAKKLYAYLTYFAGGKGYSWPSFGLLGELHCSRRHVIRLVQEHGSERYSKEELIAELGAAFLWNETGILDSVRFENSALYLASWIQKLENDPRIIVSAASQALRAAAISSWA